jgi:hypothetical protein
MTEIGELKGPLPEAVGCAGYTLAVSLFDIMVRKGLISGDEARAAFRDWSERAQRLEGTANHDAGLSGLAKYFNVQTE